MKVETTPAASEIVTALMYEMEIGGLYIEDPADIMKKKKSPTDWDYIEDALKNMDLNKIIMRAYLPEHTNVHEKVSVLKEKLAYASTYTHLDKVDVKLSEVYEKDWANNWKKYYKPVKVGKNIVIKPTWEEYKEQVADVVVQLDPGMAFGTGTHETTCMCMKLIEQYLFPECDVLDIGCGSGILGITAIKLGARHCLSVDIDPIAIKVSEQNVAINDVTHAINIVQGDLVEKVQGKYDIITANIIADAIISLSSLVAKYMLPKGVFIASGIIRERYEEVEAALLENDIFKIEQTLFEGEWAAIAVSLNT